MKEYKVVNTNQHDHSTSGEPTHEEEQMKRLETYLNEMAQEGWILAQASTFSFVGKYNGTVLFLERDKP